MECSVLNWSQTNFIKFMKIEIKVDNSYQKVTRYPDDKDKINTDISTFTKVFLNQKRVNVREHTVKIFTLCSHTFILFWLAKTSMSVKTSQFSMCSFMCVFHLTPVHFLVSYTLLFLFLCIHILVLLHVISFIQFMESTDISLGFYRGIFHIHNRLNYYFIHVNIEVLWQKLRR